MGDNPYELLEQMKANGQCPGAEIIRLRNLVAGAESRVEELEEEAKFIVSEHDTEAQAVCDLQVRISVLEASIKEDRCRLANNVRDIADATFRAFNAEARVEVLETSHTPRPMSEAPEEGTRILECYSNGERHIAWYSLVPDENRIGWLPAKDPTP